jgi:hypothetical protein
MKLAFILILSLFMTSPAYSRDLESTNIKGLSFSYRDVQQNCTAQRAGQDSLSIECRGNHLKSVSRSCGGYISRGLESAKLNCGGALWVLNQQCKIEMRSANYGEINCKT